MLRCVRSERPEQPCYRTIVAVDIVSSTTRTDMVKAHLRRELYDLFEGALHTAGIRNDLRDPLIDRGDGILALIYPDDQVPKTLLLGKVMFVLRTRLQGHRFRLRAVVHAGEVLYDRRGCFGEALDVSFRLLNAPVFKNHLTRTAAPLALVVSDNIYRTVVRHGYPGIDNRDFVPLVHTYVADQSHCGWVYMPERRTGEWTRNHSLSLTARTPLPHY